MLLTSPKLHSLEDLELVEDDILLSTNFRHRFDVVRAANILNRDYFDSESLRAMLINLRERLTPRGLLAIVSTEDDGANHGTIFRLGSDGALDVCERLGSGSQIEDLATSLPPRSIESSTIQHSLAS
jgi:hypothetical protein